ncbi:hypothetical protein EB796_001211 [Bugula neritina]|uniref:Uncharacterized protein n=1 Tax=Bugula neritina TaxID=10212 RepID=A0A7J7KQT2_BUGNE|nr:hypothetical protein EB796_001211 [Bugula neritina]
MFLFSLKAIEEKYPPDIKIEHIDRKSIRQKIEDSMKMAPTLATLSARTQLALELKDLGVAYEKLCKDLVHHQHLQNQGWRTVLSNLEDSLSDFFRQTDKFIPWYRKLLERKAQQLEMLERFPDTCELLARIPILSSLKTLFSGSSDTLLQYCTTLDETHDLLAEAESAKAALSQVTWFTLFFHWFWLCL